MTIADPTDEYHLQVLVQIEDSPPVGGTIDFILQNDDTIAIKPMLGWSDPGEIGWKSDAPAEDLSQYAWSPLGRPDNWPMRLSPPITYIAAPRGAVGFDGDEQLVLAGQSDCRTIDVKTGAVLWQSSYPIAKDVWVDCDCNQVSATGTKAFQCGALGQWCVIDTRDGTLLFANAQQVEKDKQLPPMGFCPATFSGDGRNFIFVRDSQLMSIDPAGKRIKVPVSSEVQTVAAGTTRVVTTTRLSNEQCLVIVYDSKTLTELKRFPIANGYGSTALSADQTLLATAGLTTVSLYDLETGKPRFEREVNRSFFGHGRLLSSDGFKPPIFLPDGKWMVWMGQYDNYLVDTATGKRWFRFGWGMVPCSMAVSPNGKRLAMSTGKGIAVVDVPALETAADSGRASESIVRK